VIVAVFSKTPGGHDRASRMGIFAKTPFFEAHRFAALIGVGAFGGAGEAWVLIRARQHCGHLLIGLVTKKSIPRQLQTGLLRFFTPVPSQTQSWGICATAGSAFERKDVLETSATSLAPGHISKSKGRKEVGKGRLSWWACELL